jgi:hypothetical protein
MNAATAGGRFRTTTLIREGKKLRSLCGGVVSAGPPCVFDIELICREEYRRRHPKAKVPGGPNECLASANSLQVEFRHKHRVISNGSYADRQSQEVQI